MKILKRRSNDDRVVTIYLPERFDFSMHKEFKETYEEEQRLNDIVLDMNKTQYMDSSALGMMLQLKEFADQSRIKIKITNANDNVMQIMQIAHFDKMFAVH